MMAYGFSGVGHLLTVCREELVETGRNRDFRIPCKHLIQAQFSVMPADADAKFL